MIQPLFSEEAPPHATRPMRTQNAGHDPATEMDAGQSDSQQQAEQVADHAEGVGRHLRALRETRRTTRNEVSARLKFSTRQIEALEDERWGQLPQGVSLRGMVKNYARFLDADVDAALAMLDQQVGGTQARDVASAASLGLPDVPLQAESVSRPWGWLVIILVVLFVAGFYAIERGWVPDSWLIFEWLKSLQQ